MRRIAFALWFVVMLPLTNEAFADDKRVLDLLLKKGVISQTEYQEILKEATEEEKAAPPRQDVTPSPSPAQPPGAPRSPIGSLKDMQMIEGGIENQRKKDYRDVFTTLDSVLKRSERVNVGIVAFRVHYIADSTDRKPAGTTPTDPPTGFAGSLPTRDENGFRIRNAEFYITGRLTPWATYYAEAEFAGQSEIVAQSVYMIFNDIPFLRNFPYLSRIKIGQFQHPFGIEQTTSTGLIDFVNRAYYYSGLTSVSAVDLRPGDPGVNPFGKSNGSGFLQEYDMGIEVSGKFPQLPWYPEYQAAVINGAGRNFNDNNADKDVVGRLIFSPTDGMRLYLAGYYGTGFFNGTTTVPLTQNSDFRKFRQGAMYTYFPPLFNQLVKLQGEYIEGYDNGFRRRSWYQYALVRPLSFLPNLELAYRYEQFTIDTNRPDSTLHRHTIGFNYYLHTNVKFTVNYEIKHDENGGGNENANNKNFFVTQIQFRY